MGTRKQSKRRNAKPQIGREVYDEAFRISLRLRLACKKHRIPKGRIKSRFDRIFRAIREMVEIVKIIHMIAEVLEIIRRYLESG
jgi:hypothetical protein